MQRVVHRLERGDEARFDRELRDFADRLEELRSRPDRRVIDHVPVSRGDVIRFIDPGDIDWIEAADDYMRLHVGMDVHLVRSTMRALDRRLLPHGFLRVHRSYLVNLAFVDCLVRDGGGDYSVELRDGTRLPLSRNQLRLLRDRFRCRF